MILKKFLSLMLLSLLLGMPTLAPAGEEDEVLLFSAEEVSFNQNTREVIATGHVEMSHGGYTLLADQVTYNERTGTVHAFGNVKITDPDGNALYVDEAELDDELREGFLVNLRFVFPDGSRLAARDGERISGNKTVLNYAVFTPCVICDDHPGRPPSWQVRAVRVIHDQQKKRIYYKNATLEVLGIPIIYLPYLSHPDPTVDRASGFLVPEVGLTRELGLVLKFPYHIVFSPSSDATITPILTTKEGLVLAGEYRRHLGFGQFHLEGSVTYVDERDADNLKTGDKQLRGHFFANSQFKHSENVRTRVRFQLASDDTYLRRYGFSDVDTLKSEYITEACMGRSYYAIRALWFQGLRVEDISGLTGFALPLVQLNHVAQPDRIGGVWRINFNGLALHRSDGMDTRRLSLRGSYEIPYTTRAGQILRLGIYLRGDLYNISNAERPDSPFFAGQNGTEGRFLPELSASFEWPFIKTSGSSQQIITPVITLIVAPTGGNPAALSNEDSRTFELTDTNILSIDRLPGLDQWEGGTRTNFGLKWMLHSKNLNIEAFIGESYRFTIAGNNPEDIFFSQGSGLSGHLSDLVTRFIITFDDKLTISSRMRLDNDDLTVRRNEIDATLYFKNTRVGIGYFKLNRNRQLEELEDHEEIRLHGTWSFKTNWQFFGHLTRNLTTTGSTISQGLGVMYVDDCVELSISWRKSFTSDRDIVPGSSLHFRIRLKHLG